MVKKDHHRVVQLCTRYPPGMGGVETHVHAISTELKARGHDVQVFTSDMLTELPFKRMDPDHDLFDMVDGVVVRRFRARSLKGDAQYSFMPAMVKAVIGTKADIVHAHSYGFFQTHLAMAARRMRNTRFVFTPHFHPEWASGKTDRRRLLRRVYDRVLGGRTLGTADAIICVSRGEAEALAEVGIDEDRLHIVPNGIPPSALDMDPDPKDFMDSFDLDHPMVLFAGRLAENKGLEHLVEAASLVLKDRPDVTFVLVGEDGGMRKVVERRAKELGIIDRLTFTGHIDDEDLFRSAFAACDVFVLPSIFEAFGIVILEAMALGKACVATKVGGIPDLIQDGKTGILVEPEDPEGLAEGILGLLDDRKRAKAMGARAKRRVGKALTWPSIVDRLEEVYRQVLG